MNVIAKRSQEKFGFLFIYFYRTAYRSSLNFVWRIENKRGVVIKEQVPKHYLGTCFFERFL